MTDKTKREVTPTFSDLVDMVRNNYEAGLGIDIGYAKAAKAVDKAIQGHVNQQVLEALEKVKSKAIENLNFVKVVGVSSIEEIEKEYKP